jgi:hypothetical protein
VKRLSLPQSQESKGAFDALLARRSGKRSAMLLLDERNLPS